MPRRYNLAHLILVGVVALVLTSLVVLVEAQARIAFSSDRSGNSEIYVMDADGKNQRRLSNAPIAQWDPSWSPDGKHIAFTSSGGKTTADGHWGIYVMDANGQNPQTILLTIGVPHGLLTVNTLPLLLARLGALWVVGTRKST